MGSISHHFLGILSLTLLQILPYASAQDLPPLDLSETALPDAFAYQDLPPLDLSKTPKCNKDDPNHYEALACWLWHLSLEVPDESFKSRGFTVGIRKMKCSNFTVDRVDSIYSPSKANDGINDNPTIDLSISGISAVCLGGYRATPGLSGDVRAIATGDKKALDMEVAFVTEEYKSYRLATAVNTKECKVNVEISELHFSGSTSSRLINLFANQIRSYVSSQIATTLCPTIKASLDPTLTAYIQDADTFIKKYLPEDTDIMSSDIMSPDITSPFRKRTLPEEFSFEKEAPVLVRSLEILNSFFDWWYGISHHSFWDDLFVCITSGVRNEYSVPIPKDLGYTYIEVPDYGDLFLTIKNVTIAGLDSLDRVRLLLPQGKNFFSSLETSLGLNVSAFVNLTFVATRDSMFQGLPLHEAFRVNFNVSQVKAIGELLVDIDRGQYETVYMDNVMSLINGIVNHDIPSSDVNCLLSSAKSISWPDIAAHLLFDSATFVPEGKIHKTSDTLEDDLDDMLNNFLELFLQEYKMLVSGAVLGISKGPVRKWLNDEIGSALHNATSSNVQCGEPPADLDQDFINFTQIGYFDDFNHFLHEPYTMKKINECLQTTTSSLTNLTSPWYIIDGGEISVKVTEVIVDNVDTVEKLEILSPEIDGLHLKTGLSAGASINAIPSLFAATELSYFPQNISAQVNVTTFLGDMDIHEGTAFYYDLNQLRQLKLAQVLASEHCSVAPTKNYSFYDYGSKIGFFGANLSAVFMGAPSLENKTIVMETAKHPQVKAVFSAMGEWAIGSFLETANAASNNMLAEAGKQCEEWQVSRDIPIYNDDYEVKNLMAVLVACVAIFLLAQPFMICLKRSGASSNTNQSSMTEPLLSQEEETKAAGTPKIPTPQDALVQQETLPVLSRHVIPAVIAGTIVLLLSSNLSTGASIDLFIAIGDNRTVAVPDIYSFSLVDTASKMWQAQIYPLFLLVVVFSGIWPYCKLILMFASWTAPSSALSTQSRERLLLSLDALGKFSLVDIYVLVLMVVAFRYHVDLAYNLGLDVYVAPRFGFYGFLVATCLSLVIGHVLVYFHRLSEMNFLVIPSSLSKSSLIEHKFKNKSTGELVQLSRASQILVLTGYVGALFLLTFGMIQTSFQFEIGGVAGDLISDRRITEYSLLSIGVSLRDSVEDPDGLGIFLLQAIYYFYAVITPLACIGLLVSLLVVPMDLSQKRVILVLTEMANAWSAVEVFVISIVASVLEISTFASFIIGDRCDIINEILEKNFPQFAADPTCYTVTSTVDNSICYLAAGVVINSLMVSSGLAFVHFAIREETDELCKQEHQEDSLDCTKAQQGDVTSLSWWHLCCFMTEEVVANTELPPPLLPPDQEKEIFTDEPISEELDEDDSADYEQPAFGGKKLMEMEPSIREAKNLMEMEDSIRDM